MEYRTGAGLFHLVRLPDLASHTTRYEVKIPWMLGLVATRSVDRQVPGINQLVGLAQDRIKDGIVAYRALLAIRQHPETPIAPRP